MRTLIHKVNTSNHKENEISFEINFCFYTYIKRKNLASSPTYTFGRGSTRAVGQKYSIVPLKYMFYNMFM